MPVRAEFAASAGCASDFVFRGWPKAASDPPKEKPAKGPLLAGAAPEPACCVGVVAAGLSWEDGCPKPKLACCAAAGVACRDWLAAASPGSAASAVAALAAVPKAILAPAAGRTAPSGCGVRPGGMEGDAIGAACGPADDGAPPNLAALFCRVLASFCMPAQWP